MPRIRVVDLRIEAQKQRSSSAQPLVLSEKLRAAITERLHANGNPVEATIDPVTRLYSVSLSAIPPLTPCMLELIAE